MIGVGIAGGLDGWRSWRVRWRRLGPIQRRRRGQDGKYMLAISAAPTGAAGAWLDKEVFRGRVTISAETWYASWLIS